MSDRLPDAITRLVPDVTTESDSPTMASFLRGLAIGAMVGAAIAGSALLQRRRSRSEGNREEPAADGGQRAAD